MSADLAAVRRPGSILKIKIAERPTVGIADDEASVGFVDRPRRREAARLSHFSCHSTPSNDSAMRSASETSAVSPFAAALSSSAATCRHDWRYLCFGPSFSAEIVLVSLDQHVDLVVQIGYPPLEVFTDFLGPNEIKIDRDRFHHDQRQRT